MTPEFIALMDDLMLAHQQNNGSLNLTAYYLQKGLYNEEGAWDQATNVQNYLQDEGLLIIKNENRYSELTSKGTEYRSAKNHLKKKKLFESAKVQSAGADKWVWFWRVAPIIISLGALAVALFKK